MSLATGARQMKQAFQADMRCGFKPATCGAAQCQLPWARRNASCHGRGAMPAAMGAAQCQLPWARRHASCPERHAFSTSVGAAQCLLPWERNCAQLCLQQAARRWREVSIALSHPTYPIG